MPHFSNVFWLEAIGFSVTMTLLACYQVKNPRHQLWFLCIPNTLQMIYFILIGGLSGMFTVIISTLRNILGATLPEKYIRPAISLCIVLACGLIISNADTVREYIPLGAAICIGLSAMMRSYPRIYRLLCLGGESSWLIYGIALLSPSLIVTAFLAVSSILLSIARYDFGMRLSWPLPKSRLGAKAE